MPAPPIPPGLPLVEAVGQEGQDIDPDEVIDDKHVCKIKNLFVTFDSRS
jgi:hypothetical protein